MLYSKDGSEQRAGVLGGCVHQESEGVSIEKPTQHKSFTCQ